MEDKFSLPETTTVADLTPKPTPPPSRIEIGKARRAFVTKVLPTVIACSHKLKNPPANDCVHCWEAHFKTAADMAELNKELNEGGVKSFEAKYGTKLTKAFKRMLYIEFAPLEKGVDGVSEETRATQRV